MISGNKLQSASAVAVCIGISMPMTVRRAVCIGELCAYVNTAGRVVSRTKLAMHTAGRVYSHFVIIRYL